MGIGANRRFIPDGNEDANLACILRHEFDGADRAKADAIEKHGRRLGQPLYGAVENHGIVSPRRTRGVVLRPINEAQEQSEDAKNEDADDEIIRSCFHAYDALAISRPRSPQKYSLTQG